jgi:phosphatidylinositol alpha-1,6-mannosyltransferase
MKRRILLVLTEFPPSIGGMQTHAILLSRHLYESGDEICVLTYRAENNSSKYTDCDASFPFPIHRVLSRVGYFFNLQTLLKHIDKFNPDLIYSSTVFYGIIQKLASIPTICRSVGNDIMRPWIAYPFRPGSRLASNPYLEKRLHDFFKKMDKPELVEILFREKRLELTIKADKACTKILANSRYTSNLLQNAGVKAKNIDIVTGGVDSNFFKKPDFINKKRLRQELGLPWNRKILLTACRLVDKKGVNFLITSLAAAEPETNNLHLVIVGKGRRLAQLRRLSYTLGIDEHVTFVGAVPYEKMPPYYWAADVFTLASIIYKDPITGLEDAETMGRVLCEANAASLPIIATESGGIPSVIANGHNGFLFPENDVAQLHENLFAVLENDKLRNQLIENGVKLAQNKFDWKHIIDQHEESFCSHPASPASISNSIAAKP